MAETEETVEQKLERYATVIGLQKEEIDRLRNVVAKLTEGADDAHSTLRRIYLNEAESSNARIKAAQASINYEKSRLENVPPALELTAKPVEPLADLVARRRRRQAALEGLDYNDPANKAKFLAWVERPDHTYPAEDDQRNGNDSAGNSGIGGDTSG
jgi:hypothetical protein